MRGSIYERYYTALAAFWNITYAAFHKLRTAFPYTTHRCSSFSIIRKIVCEVKQVQHGKVSKFGSKYQSYIFTVFIWGRFQLVFTGGLMYIKCLLIFCWCSNVPDNQYSSNKLCNKQAFRNMAAIIWYINMSQYAVVHCFFLSEMMKYYWVKVHNVICVKLIC